MGVQFLKHKRLAIDMSNRKISKNCIDGSVTHFYLKDNRLETIMHENVSVTAAQDVKLSESGESVPIDLSVCCGVPGRTEFFFEGKVGQDVRGLDGVVSAGSSHPTVVVCSTRAGKTIRKGDIVGRVSTLLELEPEEDQLDCWTIEKLREEITFSQSLDNKQVDDAYKMLLAVQGVLSDSDIGTARVAPHVIELTNDTPIWQKPRRFPSLLIGK